MAKWERAWSFIPALFAHLPPGRSHPQFFRGPLVAGFPVDLWTFPQHPLEVERQAWVYFTCSCGDVRLCPLKFSQEKVFLLNWSCPQVLSLPPGNKSLGGFLLRARGLHEAECPIQRPRGTDPSCSPHTPLHAPTCLITPPSVLQRSSRALNRRRG